MNIIKNWLSLYNITTHSVAAVLAFLVGAYFSVPEFHALVLQIYTAIPTWAQELLTTGIALYAWYRKGSPIPDAPVDGANSIKLGE